MAIPRGFQFDERMSGTFTLAGSGDEPRRMSFTARMKAADALRHLRDGMAELEGTLDAEGFADDVPISGTLEIRPFTKRIIRYEFSFVANDGKPYRFAGQKDIRFSHLIGSWTHLEGQFLDMGGREVGHARIRFDLRADLLPLLVSLKPAV